MIFVTVGTHHQPFVRLLEALGGLSGDEDLIVQHGPAPAPARATRAMPYVSFGEMLTYFGQARVVITHAGVGSILCATRLGHTPIVVPRLRRHGEHVDDHQSELVRALQPEGNVIALWDMTKLREALRSVPPRGEVRAPTEGPLHVAVSGALRRPPSARRRALLERR